MEENSHIIEKNIQDSLGFLKINLSRETVDVSKEITQDLERRDQKWEKSKKNV